MKLMEAYDAAEKELTVQVIVTICSLNSFIADIFRNIIQAKQLEVIQGKYEPIKKVRLII